MSHQTCVIAGIEVDVWSNTRTADSPIARLPVAILILMHGRNNTRKDVEPILRRMLEIQADPHRTSWERELLVVTFDQRNHGTRLVDGKANQGWDLKRPDRHNERHAVDLYAMQAGSAADVSTLIDFLPSYLYPNAEREIDHWSVAGFSMGGHSTWIALKNDTRLGVGVPIVGCPDFLGLMMDRAIGRGISTSNPVFPAQLLAHVRKHDPAATAYTSNSDENPFLNKRILAIAGGKDTLVPWNASRAFFEQLEVGPQGVKELFIDEDAGHKWTDAMGDRIVVFIEKHCLL